VEKIKRAEQILATYESLKSLRLNANIIPDKYYTVKEVLDRDLLA
jgi:hypothetical protein